MEIDALAPILSGMDWIGNCTERPIFHTDLSLLSNNQLFYLSSLESWGSTPGNSFIGIRQDRWFLHNEICLMCFFEFAYLFGFFKLRPKVLDETISITIT